MIFYFSGTGNSLYAAKIIAEKQGSKIFDISQRLKDNQLIFVPEEGEIVGFVFPVYAWAPPQIVLEFIQKMSLARKDNYIFALATCGGEAGGCMDLLRSFMMKNKIPLNADFSLLMPDNFFYYSQKNAHEEAQKILNNANEKLLKINEAISKRQNGSFSEKGSLAKFKTGIISPLFNRFYDPSKKFYTNKKCTSCGFCAKICPTNNISFNSGQKPVWGKSCIACLGCLNRCPFAAIEWGSKTIGKKRYYNPFCKSE